MVAHLSRLGKHNYNLISPGSSLHALFLVPYNTLYAMVFFRIRNDQM